MSTPLGTKRGCGKYIRNNNSTFDYIRFLGDDRCEVQFNVGTINTANLCCTDNLCNSSIQVKLSTISIILTIVFAFMYTQSF